MKMTEKSFEKETWKRVQEFKGFMDVSEYKQLLLGLIFLKYISIKFEEKYQELVEEGKGHENNSSYYKKDHIIFIPEEANWKNIVPEIFHNAENIFQINEAIMIIEKENMELEGVIPKLQTEKINTGNLGIYTSLLATINDIENDSSKIQTLFNYCLNKFAELGGKKGDDFYTPESIIKTVIELLEPTQGKIYDPCCGSAGFLIESSKFAKMFDETNNNMSLYGQESNPTNWKIAKMNLIINQLHGDIGKEPCDTLRHDLHPGLKADYIMANPPFNQKWLQNEVKEDERWRYGLSPKGNANYAWMQHMIHHLSNNGKMAIVLPNGALIHGGVEGKIREAILKENIVETIISLPSQLFYTTAIPTNIWIINKNKQQEGILFIEARELGTMENRTHRKLENNDIQLLKDIYNKYLRGTLEEKIGFCKVVTLEDIEKEEYDLTPGRYGD